MPNINLRPIHAMFDLCERDGLMKLHILQGQEIPHWEDGIDMISYIRQMSRQGYTNLTQSGGACFFSRRSGRKSAA